MNLKHSQYGAVRATDNSVITLYNSKYDRDKNYFEASTNSMVSDDKTKTISFSKSNAFANFPVPIYEVSSNKDLNTNTTGFDSDLTQFLKTDEQIITNISGKITSILYNDGSQHFLTSLSDGICLSDIQLIIDTPEKLTQVLSIIPKNLNGSKLLIKIVQNSQQVQLNQQVQTFKISNFVCGIVQIICDVSKNIICEISNCRNLVINSSKNTTFILDSCINVQLNNNNASEFLNCFFNVKNSNIVGNENTFSYNSDISASIFNLENSSCYIDNKSIISSDYNNIRKFSASNNSQATWIDADISNSLIPMSEIASSNIYLDTLSTETKKTTLNHQHIFYEPNVFDENMLIGYPIAWSSKISGQTEFTKENLSSLLIPIPSSWKPVVLDNQYISLSDVSNLDTSAFQYVLGK